MSSSLRASTVLVIQIELHASAPDRTPVRGCRSSSRTWSTTRKEVHHRPSTCASAASACGQPEGHVHGAVQLDGGRQLGAGLFLPADLGIQVPRPQVAVGLERAHAEFLGQGEGLLVVGFGLLGIGGIGVGMDDAKLVQRDAPRRHGLCAAGPGRAPGGRAARPPRRVPPDDRPR